MTVLVVMATRKSGAIAWHNARGIESMRDPRYDEVVELLRQEEYQDALVVLRGIPPPPLVLSPPENVGEPSMRRIIKCATFMLFENIDAHIFRHRVNRFCKWSAMGRFIHCDNADGRYDGE